MELRILSAKHEVSPKTSLEASSLLFWRLRVVFEKKPAFLLTLTCQWTGLIGLTQARSLFYFTPSRVAVGAWRVRTGMTLG